MDIFSLCKVHGDQTAIVTLTQRLLYDSLDQIGSNLLKDKVNESVIQIQEGYAQFNVSYHNDKHGFDVAQMTYILLYGDDGLI